MENELKDWRGHTIKVGTPVAYPVRVGNSPGIKSGIVLEIKLDPPNGEMVKIQPDETAPFSRNWSSKPRTLRWPTTHNLVVLPRTNHEAPVFPEVQAAEAPADKHCRSCDGHACPEVG